MTTQSDSPPRTSLSAIPRGVWALGFVSLLMDTSSEMIHALLPVFLLSVFQGKHHHYLLPVTAPWAVLGALGAARMWEAFGRASVRFHSK